MQECIQGFKSRLLRQNQKALYIVVYLKTITQYVVLFSFMEHLWHKVIGEYTGLIMRG